MADLIKIIEKFGLKTTGFRYEQINTGHINDTYKIYSDNNTYILQKVNTKVFNSPEKVMHNIETAQSCIRNSVRSAEFIIPDYLKANEKNYLCEDGFWRIYRYIESSSDTSGKNSVYGFGKILAKFHKYTENADISVLYDTIPDFHSIEKNISLVIEHPDVCHEKFYEDFFYYYTQHKNVFSKKRLVHNDVKWANVLIDPITLEPVALIDYDTVMAGYGAFDFGDAVRSSCADKNNSFSKNKLKQFAKGYFSCYQNLSSEECALGIISVTAELSARYLYDYVSNENYFKNLTAEQKYLKYSALLELAKNMFSIKNEIISVIDEARNRITDF